MTDVEIKSASEQTRQRLLDAAREVFSQHSFQGATVREICRLADANVAAVNYHFGSKDGLLAEALNFTQLATLQKANVKLAECPEIRLRLFLRDFMLMLLDEKNPSSQCRIMARELADPTPALDKIVREAIAPLLCVQHRRPMFVLSPFASGVTAPAPQTALRPQGNRSDQRAHCGIFARRDQASRQSQSKLN
jgi:AcrR family transcriptional regulator